MPTAQTQTPGFENNSSSKSDEVSPTLGETQIGLPQPGLGNTDDSIAPQQVSWRWTLLGVVIEFIGGLHHRCDDQTSRVVVEESYRDLHRTVNKDARRGLIP
jgi:hypothetical protein